MRDLLPTLCDLAEVSAKSEKSLDGTSLKPLLLGDAGAWPDRILINHWKSKVSARSQRFRLDHAGKLFDMVADPGQRRAVTREHPEVVKKLAARVRAHSDQFMAGYYHDARPFVIAHPESSFTQLPARDGTAHGKIKRSNKFPNCSYFMDWTSIDDKISWTAEVGASGTYEIVLYYAAEDAGAKCELSFKDYVLAFQIAEAHDVPELGAENDRYPRTESYVKDFKAVSIGRIKLEKGEGELVLRATEIPGAEAMEFRLLTLERVK